MLGIVCGCVEEKKGGKDIILLQQIHTSIIPWVRPLQPPGRQSVLPKGRALHQAGIVDFGAVGGQELPVLFVFLVCFAIRNF